MPQRASAIELLVRDRVERPDVAAVAPRQLIQPDVGALCHEHQPRHPVAIDVNRSSRRGRRRRRPRPGHRRRRRGWRSPVADRAFLGQDVERDEELVEQVVEDPAEQPAQLLADPAQLVGERAGRCRGRLAQELEEGAASGPNPGRRRRSPRGRRPPRSGSAFAHRPQVDQLAERVDGGVLVRGWPAGAAGRWRSVGRLGDGQAGRELPDEGAHRGPAARCRAARGATRRPRRGPPGRRRPGSDRRAGPGSQDAGGMQLAGGQRWLGLGRGERHPSGGWRRSSGAVARPVPRAAAAVRPADPRGNRARGGQVRGEGIGQAYRVEPAGPAGSSHGGPAAGMSAACRPAPTAARSAARARSLAAGAPARMGRTRRATAARDRGG